MPKSTIAARTCFQSTGDPVTRFRGTGVLTYEALSPVKGLTLGPAFHWIGQSHHVGNHANENP